MHNNLLNISYLTTVSLHVSAQYSHLIRALVLGIPRNTVCHINNIKIVRVLCGHVWR